MKVVHSYLLILAFSLAQNAFTFAQPVFQNTIGGDKFEYGYALRLTPDGGCIIGGVTNSSFTPAGNGHDQYLVKTDSLGTVVWAKSYGTPAIEVVNDVYCCSGGGYIFGGYSSVSGGGNPLDGNYVVRVNQDGDTLWSRIFNFREKGGDCYALLEADDGNYIIANYTPAGLPDGFLASLIKLDQNGDTIWVKSYDGPGDEWIYGIDKTGDGGYILSGYTTTNSAGGEDFLLLKTDSAGDMEWAKAYGGPQNEDAYGHSVVHTFDGGFVVAGETKSYGAGNSDVLLIKTNSSGTVQWSKTYGGIADDIGHAVVQTSDSGYVIAGWTKSWGAGVFSAKDNVYLIRTDPGGDTLWTRVFGGTGSGTMGDMGYDVKETLDGYLVCGRTASFGSANDIYLIKTDLNGNSPCNMFYTDTRVSSQSVTTSVPLLQQLRGARVVHPATQVAGGGSSQNLCSAVGVENPVRSADGIIVFQDPATSSITIIDQKQEQILFFDLFGRCLSSVSANPGVRMKIDISSFTDLFIIRTENGESKKMMKSNISD
jgi:hypothetical protein